MSELLTYFEGQKQAMVDLLTELVGYESFSSSKEHVDKLTDVMEGKFKTLGATSIQRIPQTKVGDFLLAKWNEDAPGKPILFLVHIDTVWPIGTLAERPVRIEDDGKLYGPGAIDMKGGIVIMLTALRGLLERGDKLASPVWILMNTDEELGSVDSEKYIRETAQQAGLVLVMEPATRDGALKTWRKGVGSYTVKVEGRASHAGNAPEQGINAVVEIAKQIVKINELNDYKNGTSVSVDVVQGGIATNVIAPSAVAHIDVRTLTAKAWDGIKEQIMNLTPFLPGAKVEVQANASRGPMEHNDLMIKTYAQCKAIAEKNGVTVREDGSGGGSDGNFTAHMGIPTLDGLGPHGDGLHALHEHVIINSLPKCATIIAGMLRDWDFSQ